MLVIVADMEVGYCGWHDGWLFCLTWCLVILASIVVGYIGILSGMMVGYFG